VHRLNVNRLRKAQTTDWPLENEERVDLNGAERETEAACDERGELNVFV
jgi:hypothetical protein